MSEACTTRSNCKNFTSASAAGCGMRACGSAIDQSLFLNIPYADIVYYIGRPNIAGFAASVNGGWMHIDRKVNAERHHGNTDHGGLAGHHAHGRRVIEARQISIRPGHYKATPTVYSNLVARGNGYCVYTLRRLHIHKPGYLWAIFADCFHIYICIYVCVCV